MKDSTTQKCDCFKQNSTELNWLDSLSGDSPSRSGSSHMEFWTCSLLMMPWVRTIGSFNFLTRSWVKWSIFWASCGLMRGSSRDDNAGWTRSSLAVGSGSGTSLNNQNEFIKEMLGIKQLPFDVKSSNIRKIKILISIVIHIQWPPEAWIYTC